MEKNVQFQVGIYHEKFQHEKIQNVRPAATSDRQIFSLTRSTQHILCFAIVECALVSNDFHF